MTIPETPEPSLPDDPDLPDTKKPTGEDEPATSRVFTLLLGPPSAPRFARSVLRAL
jgi:hypothetical protein